VPQSGLHLTVSGHVADFLSPSAFPKTISNGSQTVLPAKLFSFLYMCKICTHSL